MKYLLVDVKILFLVYSCEKIIYLFIKKKNKHVSCKYVDFIKSNVENYLNFVAGYLI
jgi:hypothetical protein